MSDEPGETFVIETLTSELGEEPDWLACGPGDDVAVFHDGTTVTMDAMAEGVHFHETDDPESIGAKLVAVNASDLAASGAHPKWAVLALSLPDPIDRDWVVQFSRGLLSELARSRARLIGGDTTRSTQQVHAALTMGGTLPGPHLSRSGANAGEDLWVSGVLGDAGAAFTLPGAPPEVLSALHRPTPPLELGPALAESGLATAAMDISDGLAVDLARLCSASNVGAVVQPDQLPASDWLKEQTADPVPLQVGFGEDYELLFTARPEHRRDIELIGREKGLSLTAIGRTVCGGGSRLAGREWPQSWSHFPESR